MVIFNDGYYNALDRYQSEPAAIMKEQGVEKPNIAIDSKTISMESIGDSLWFHGKDAMPLPALNAKIRQGAGHIEVAAVGTGRGDQNSPTYENIDSEQRKEFKQLSELNEIDVSVHSTPSVWGLAGFDNREGFSKQQRFANIQEIKKAIDFAADATRGGSVVVHTGEFPRSLATQNWNNENTSFHLYPEEKSDAIHYLVDGRTGRIIKSVKADEVVFIPDQEEEKDKSKVWMTDEQGNKIYDDILKAELVDEYNARNKTDVSWDALPDDVKRNAWIPVWKIDADKNIITRKTTFEEWKNDRMATGMKEDKVVKEFFKEQQMGQVQQALGSARQFEREYTDGLEEIEKIKKTLRFYKELKEKVPESDWHLYKQQTHGARHAFIPSEVSDPVKYLQDALNDTNRRIAYGRETSLSGRRQARELLRMLNKVGTIQDYGVEQSKKSYAELGIYAMERSRHTEKPVFISLENIYPETYGAHPQELRNLVETARKEMANELVTKMQYGESEAKKAAEEHIKITLDTGHLNTWRKYFKPNDNESKEEADKRFKKWYLKEVEKLAENKMIGNVHLADNMGYDDAHLAPGYGTAPTKEVLEILDKHGYAGKMAVEGGFQQGRIGYQEAWRFVDSPVYSVTPAFSRGGWSGIMNSHHGYGAPPNYIVGAYAPSNEWHLWSEVPLE